MAQWFFPCKIPIPLHGNAFLYVLLHGDPPHVPYHDPSSCLFVHVPLHINFDLRAHYFDHVCGHGHNHPLCISCCDLSFMSSVL